MGNSTNRKLMEERLNPLRDEMTGDRFTRLITEAVQIEARCKDMALFPADGTPIMPGFAPLPETMPAPAESIGRKGDSARHRKIKLELTSRLRAACSHCTEIEFVRLIEHMARIQLRGESQRAGLVAAIDRRLTPA
jgi:hypothetical protein